MVWEWNTESGCRVVVVVEVEQVVETRYSFGKVLRCGGEVFVEMVSLKGIVVVM